MEREIGLSIYVHHGGPAEVAEPTSSDDLDPIPGHELARVPEAAHLLQIDRMRFRAEREEVLDILQQREERHLFRYVPVFNLSLILIRICFVWLLSTT
jgi:hypothetical protein